MENLVIMLVDVYYPVKNIFVKKNATLGTATIALSHKLSLVIVDNPCETHFVEKESK